VGTEEVSKAKKLSNLVNISRGSGISDSGELIKARQNTFRGKPETKVSDVGRAKVTFFKVKFKVGLSKTIKEKLET
jgi:hypothetical protein